MLRKGRTQGRAYIPGWEAKTISSRKIGQRPFLQFLLRNKTRRKPSQKRGYLRCLIRKRSSNMGELVRKRTWAALGWKRSRFAGAFSVRERQKRADPSED